MTAVAAVPIRDETRPCRRSNHAPEWGLGLAMGFGGLLGSYTGAHLQRRLPERAIRRTLDFSAS
jgi:uncharacterized membrane protein YfcA